MPDPRLIHLVAAAKSFPRPGLGPRIVLVPGTISLPTDRMLAVLAARRQGKTTLLQLLAGHLTPDQGEILAGDDVSPVINASTLFHPQLSAIDNVRFIARLYGLRADPLLLAIDSLARTTLQLEHPLKTQDKAQRRHFEAATIFVLPFGCYLIDDIGQLDAELVADCLKIATQRNAGVIFSTSQPRFALQYGEAAAILDAGQIRLFGDVGEAVEAFELLRHA